MKRKILVCLSVALMDRSTGHTPSSGSAHSKYILFYDGYCQIAIQEGCTIATVHEDL